METKIKKRYKISDTREYQIYDDEFDRLVISSDILGETNQPNITTRFYDRQELLSTLALLVGVNGNDWYKEDRSGHTILSYIPYMKQKLAEIETRFTEFNERREAAGYKRSDLMPPLILKEKLLLEARLDVYLREEESIRLALNNLKVDEDNKQDELCLQHGPQGNGRLRGGDLVELDGQKVERIKGRLIITSPSSPYRGLLVSDYRERISDVWTKARNDLHLLMSKKAKEEIKATGHSSIVVPSRRSGTKISKSSLPPWPAGVRNWLTDKDDPEENNEE
jgi:hypothetical protein